MELDKDTEALNTLYARQQFFEYRDKPNMQLAQVLAVMGDQTILDTMVAQNGKKLNC